MKKNRLILLFFLLVLIGKSADSAASEVDKSCESLRFSKLFENLSELTAKNDCDDACLLSFYTMTKTVYTSIKEISQATIPGAVRNSNILSYATDLLFERIRFHPMNLEEKTMIKFYYDHIGHFDGRVLGASEAGMFLIDHLSEIHSELIPVISAEITPQIHEYIRDFVQVYGNTSDAKAAKNTAEKIIEFAFSTVEKRVMESYDSKFEDIWSHSLQKVSNKLIYKNTIYFDVESYQDNFYLYIALSILNNEEFGYH